jgi:hypothetical protein
MSDQSPRISATEAIRIIPHLCGGAVGSLGVVGNRAVVTMHIEGGEVWADGSVHDTFDHFPLGADGRVSLRAIRAALGY